MSIEVIHNPDRLPIHRRFSVANPTRAEFVLRQLMQSRQPRGMRLRHVYDAPGKWIELSARHGEPVRVALRYLKDCGFRLKEIRSN